MARSGGVKPCHTVTSSAAQLDCCRVSAPAVWRAGCQCVRRGPVDVQHEYVLPVPLAQVPPIIGVSRAGTHFWLEKQTFVRPLYPPECTDDRGTETFSVAGRPGPARLDSGEETFSVPQQRNQAPGWDGCRHRADNRTDVPQRLQWEQPAPVAWHKAVYLPDQHRMLVHGGIGFAQEEAQSASRTFDVQAQQGLWSFHLRAYTSAGVASRSFRLVVNARGAGSCVSGCSGHGVCHYGHCLCEQGFYGIDCSNGAPQSPQRFICCPALSLQTVSCPGDVCLHDPYTWEQRCLHCCYAMAPGAARGEWVKVTAPCCRRAAGHALCSSRQPTGAVQCGYGSWRPCLARHVQRIGAVPVRAALRGRGLLHW